MPKLDATTETVENYLKAIHRLAGESPTGEAGMKAIGTMVGVATGTATAMVKRLAEAKLARYERFGGVRLTPKGEKAALDILRRHRLVETFLVNTLRLDWSIVHHEAERLEHALSPAVIEALDAFLGHPATDPHGDPIPKANGRIAPTGGAPLASFKPGEVVAVLRITDQDATFLTFAAAHALKPGESVEVAAVDPFAQTMHIRTAGAGDFTLALPAAAKIVCASCRR